MVVLKEENLTDEEYGLSCGRKGLQLLDGSHIVNAQHLSSEKQNSTK
jgi:hypothetical protein